MLDAVVHLWKLEFWWKHKKLDQNPDQDINRNTRLRRPKFDPFSRFEIWCLPIMFAIDMTANDIENDESDDQNQNKYH